jgi:hypothetical protein
MHADGHPTFNRVAGGRIDVDIAVFINTRLVLSFDGLFSFQNLTQLLRRIADNHVVYEFRMDISIR